MHTDSRIRIEEQVTRVQHGAGAEALIKQLRSRQAGHRFNPPRTSTYVPRREAVVDPYVDPAPAPAGPGERTSVIREGADGKHVAVPLSARPGPEPTPEPAPVPRWDQRLLRRVSAAFGGGAR